MTYVAVNGEVPASINPYLNPQYWGEAMLGDGKALEAPRLPEKMRYGVAATLKLASYLARRPVPYPLDKFRPGDVFDCNDHGIGTVVIYNQESLTATQGSFDVAGHENEEIVRSPADFPFRIRSIDEIDDPNSYALTNGNVEYRSSTMFGVIVKTGRNRRHMFSIAGSAIFAAEPRGVNINELALPTPTPVRLGETAHYRANKTAAERLVRINVLAICGIGEPKPVRETERRVLGASIRNLLPRGIT